FGVPTVSMNTFFVKKVRWWDTVIWPNPSQHQENPSIPIFISTANTGEKVSMANGCQKTTDRVRKMVRADLSVWKTAFSNNPTGYLRRPNGNMPPWDLLGIPNTAI